MQAGIDVTAHEPHRVFPLAATLGEGPVWDAGRERLWLVDIKKQLLHAFDPSRGTLQSWHAPGQIGWALPGRDRRLLAGLQDGLYVFDPEQPGFHLHCPLPGTEPSHNRLNDAVSDNQGAVWFGSMDDEEDSVSGRYYRYARGRIVETDLPPVRITNGPALSCRGDRLYHVDTLGRVIHVCDLDQTGKPGPSRPFVHIEDSAGYPDGPSIDSEDCLWIALFGGWAVRRYSPEGVLLAEIPFPVANVTKIAFGGDDLRTAFATTARHGLDAAALERQPMAGDLFAFDVDVPGQPPCPVEI